MGLTVGLTGGLGSGKSTVARMLESKGARVISADELGRSLMEPGTAVFAGIVERFGVGVVRSDGRLDRSALAKLAFADGRVEELNAIVHPATIALQRERAAEIFAEDSKAIVVVESALIFESLHGGSWRERFDALVLVTASEELKVERFVSRANAENEAAPGSAYELRTEALRRLSRMLPDAQKTAQCDFVVSNAGTLEELAAKVDALWRSLLEMQSLRRVRDV